MGVSRNWGVEGRKKQLKPTSRNLGVFYPFE